MPHFTVIWNRWSEWTSTSQKIGKSQQSVSESQDCSATYEGTGVGMPRYNAEIRLGSHKREVGKVAPNLLSWGSRFEKPNRKCASRMWRNSACSAKSCICRWFSICTTAIWLATRSQNIRYGVWQWPCQSRLAVPTQTVSVGVLWKRHPVGRELQRKLSCQCCDWKLQLLKSHCCICRSSAQWNILNRNKSMDCYNNRRIKAKLKCLNNFVLILRLIFLGAVQFLTGFVSS